MEGAKKTPLSARKKPMRKSRRLVRSIVAYLKTDAYLYAPLLSDFSPLPPPPYNSESSKEEDLHVGGKLQVTNLVTMVVSKNSRRTMRKDNNNSMNLSSTIVEHALHNGRISSPKGSPVILEEQRSRETDLSPPFSSLPKEKTVKPDPRRVPIE